MNRYILGSILVVFYTFVMLALVFTDNGFEGMKWLTIWFFASTLFVGFWLGYIYITTPIDELQAEKKGYILGHIKLGVVIVIAMATGLNKKLAILFLDIDRYATELKEDQVVMRGESKFKPVGPRSAGGGFPVMDVLGGERGWIPSCHLILKDSCEYGYMVNQVFDIKYIDGFSYPLKLRTLVFEIRSKDFYRGIDYHINLYKSNQRYVFYFFIFVVLASMIIVFLVPYLMWKKPSIKIN